MKLVDMFCGVGGFSAGAREFAKPLLGVDNDDVMVRLWAANTKGKGQLAELWRDHVELPRPTDSTQESVHIHISPPCRHACETGRAAERVLTPVHGLK